MTKPRPRPALKDFVAGYPGPAEIEFRGGSVTVVAALIYADGIRIEWRMPLTPDLTWMDDVTLVVEREVPPELRNRPDLVDAFLHAERLRELWDRAWLADDGGREFELSLERSGPLSRFGGIEGTATCRCQPTPDATGLTLHFGGTEVVISLTSDGRLQDGRSSLFKAGYPGPKPIPFHDGAIKLISVMVYQDRITIEWLAHPVPELSWLFNDTVSDYLRPQIADEERRLMAARAEMSSRRTFALWMGARLTDNLRTQYQGSLGNGGGFRGEVNFTPSPPQDARELNLVLYDLSVFIPLR